MPLVHAHQPKTKSQPLKRPAGAFLLKRPTAPNGRVGSARSTGLVIADNTMEYYDLTHPVTQPVKLIHTLMGPWNQNDQQSIR